MIDSGAQRVLDDIAEKSAGRAESKSAAERLARARHDTDSLVRFTGAVPAGVDCGRRMVTGRNGPIEVEIIRRDEGPAERPLLIWFHGGGAIAGSLDTHRSALAHLAERSGWTVASVAYHLAPEHPFPVPLEDCLDAALDLTLGVKGPIAVGGDSIGGLFAANVARLWRSESLSQPPIAAQVLIYPNTDARQDQPYSSREENEGRVMTRDSLRFEADCHVPRVQDRENDLASPVLATDLAGLPPALIVTCELDPLRDEGLEYRDRLRETGVEVEHRQFEGMIHGFLQMGRMVPATEDLAATVAAFLGRFAARS